MGTPQRALSLYSKPMDTNQAWGIGLATVTKNGETLDVWYPRPHLGQMEPVVE